MVQHQILVPANWARATGAYDVFVNARFACSLRWNATFVIASIQMPHQMIAVCLLISGTLQISDARLNVNFN